MALTTLPCATALACDNTQLSQMLFSLLLAVYALSFHISSALIYLNCLLTASLRFLFYYNNIPLHLHLNTGHCLLIL
jgi:hypothetical protein